MPCCVAVNCSNRSEKGFRLFRFPANVRQRTIWIQNMRKGDNWVPTRFSYLCEKHFENSQFESNRKDGRRKLKPNSIPTLFDVPNPPPVIDLPPMKSEYEMPETESGSEIIINEQITSLLAENECLKQKIRRMHAMLKRLSSHPLAKKHIEKYKIASNKKNDRYPFSRFQKNV